MLRRGLVALCGALIIAAPAGQCIAHTQSSSHLEIVLEDQRPVTLSITLALIDLLQVLPLDANEDLQLTWGEVGAGRADILSHVVSGIRISSQNDRCTLDGDNAEFKLRRWSGTPSLNMFMPVACTKAVSGAATRPHYNVNYSLFFDVDPAHKALLQVSDGRDEKLLVLSSAQRERTLETQSSMGRGFVGDGFRHILAGYDHIAFLLLLILPAVAIGNGRSRLMHIGKIVTAFTLAHSITLAAAITGTVHLPTGPVEIAIAASVVLAGVMNAWRPSNATGWKLAAAFGLLHGFGFASALQELEISGPALWTALLTFNIGIELGQLAIVALVLPVFLVMARSSRYQSRLVPAVSLCCAAVGVLWTVARLPDF